MEVDYGASEEPRTEQPAVTEGFLFWRNVWVRSGGERVSRATEATFVVDLEQDEAEQANDSGDRVETGEEQHAPRQMSTEETGEQGVVPSATALPPLPVDDDTWWNQEVRQSPMDEYGRAMGARTAEDLKTGYYNDHRPEGMTDEEFEDYVWSIAQARIPAYRSSG